MSQDLTPQTITAAASTLACSRSDRSGPHAGARRARALAWLLLLCSAFVLVACDAGAPQPGDDAGVSADAGVDLEAERAAFIEAIVATDWISPCMPIAQDAEGNLTYGVFQIGNPVGTKPYFQATGYGDEGCTFALFEARILSEREYGARLPGDIWELTVHFEEIYATPFVDGLVDAFEAQGCGTGQWVVGQEQDVTATGCLIFKSVSECPADYDILRIDDDQLYNGVRTDNMCAPEGRPTALNAWAFSRVQE